jgi:hypothetical protein
MQLLYDMVATARHQGGCDQGVVVIRDRKKADLIYANKDPS